MKKTKKLLLVVSAILIGIAFFSTLRQTPKPEPKKTNYAQYLDPLPSPSAKGLKVSGHIVETGMNDGMPSYIISAELYNTTEVPITYSGYTCDWISSWRFAPSQYFLPPTLVCDSNSLRSVTIAPNEKALFRIPLVAYKKWNAPDGIKIRIGFILCAPDIYSEIYGKNDTEEITAWSDEIIFPKVDSGPALRLWKF